MRKVIASIEIIILLLLCGCATTNTDSVPSWVAGRQSEVLSANYILAVGCAQSRESADEDARLGLASFFGSNIKSQTYSGITSFNKGGSLHTDQIYKSDLLIDVNVDNLVCIEELESYVDKDGNIYILLGMNKRGALVHYAGKLAEINKEIATEYSMIDSSPRNLANCIAFAKLREKVSEATELCEIIKLIDSSYAASVIVSAAQVDLLRQSFVNAIVFSLEIKGDADAVKTSISKVVTDNGYSVSEEQTPNVITMNLVLSNILGNTKNAFCGYELSVEIKDISEGKKYFSWSKQGREAMATYDQAKAKVIYNLTKEIEDSFLSVFAAAF